MIRFREQQERARIATRWLVALFALTVVLTVAGVNLALALAWRLQFGGFFGYPRWFFETNTVVTLGFVLGGAWLQGLQLREGGAAVARLLGAREVAEPHTTLEKRLRNVVDEMALASALPSPGIFVLDREDAINAFAAGWEPADSVITVTRSALERLDRDELQGVVAHEFAHVLNGDTRLNMRLIGMVFGLQMVFTFGRSLMSPVDDRGRRGPTWLAGLALAAAGSIGWFAGRLLKAGVSREREHLADAAALQFTRQPDGLGNALRKIATQVGRGERLEHANSEFVSHLLLASDTAVAGRWLATHPPLAERIHRIFGRDLPPLPDDVLAVDDEEVAKRDLPPLAFEATPVPVAPVAAAAAIEDPLELSAASPPETIAAAVLACLLPQAPQPAQLQAWRRLAPGGSPHLVAAMQSLSPLQRQSAFERVLAGVREWPPARRAALLAAARELAQSGGGVSLMPWLQVAVLQAQLAPREPKTAASHLTIAQAAPSIEAVTLDLATLLPPAQRAGWIAAVRRELALPAAMPAADPRGLAAAVDRLALLAPVQRPAVLKAWVAADASLPPALAPALACLCLLIDTPAPPELHAAMERSHAVAEAPQA